MRCWTETSSKGVTRRQVGKVELEEHSRARIWPDEAGVNTWKGQVAVVTGASSGVGRALALCLGAGGATVCLVGRNLERLEGVMENVRTKGPEVRSYQADLTVDEDIWQLAQGLERDWGSVDVLVHSAGIISLGRMEEVGVEAFDWQYRINVRAPYLLTQALLPMIKSRQGQIVFINSTAGLTARAGVGQYAATKHALKALADSLRDEVNEDGVRVLSVFLGRTATPMQAGIHEKEGRTYRPERLVQPEDVAAVVISALTLPRTTEVTEIALRPLKKPM